MLGDVCLPPAEESCKIFYTDLFAGKDMTEYFKPYRIGKYLKQLCSILADAFKIIALTGRIYNFEFFHLSHLSPHIRIYEYFYNNTCLDFRCQAFSYYSGREISSHVILSSSSFFTEMAPRWASIIVFASERPTHIFGLIS